MPVNLASPAMLCLCNRGGVETLIKRPVYNPVLYTQQPIPRIAKAERIAASITYLLVHESLFINGTAVVISRGWTA